MALPWRFMSGSDPSHDLVARHVRSLPRSGIREFFDLVQGQPDVSSLGVGGSA